MNKVKNARMKAARQPEQAKAERAVIDAARFLVSADVQSSPLRRDLAFKRLYDRLIDLEVVELRQEGR